MRADDADTDDLLARAERGDRSALGRLLGRYRRRLRRLIAPRLDRRMAARVDPSDVVQETLADAGRRLPEYLRHRPVGLFPWLRQLAIQRLVWWHRFHLRASKRSVARELAERSSPAGLLAERLMTSGTSPSGHAIREEERARVRAAVEALAARDREILNLRYVEDLSFAEIADRLGAGIGAVKMRHLRAIERVRAGIDEMARGPADS
jgi:RNA polymerase sigma-70 factor (ECF subfamily)